MTAGWAATLGLIAVLLVLDLLVSGRRPHAVGFREAVVQSVSYITVAVGDRVGIATEARRLDQSALGAPSTTDGGSGPQGIAYGLSL